MECNERIKQYRLQAELTQQQLADKIGVSRQTIVRWEGGFVMPTLYYAKRLAEFFGTSVNELTTGNKDSADSPAVRSIGTATARFSILTFVPIALYVIIYYLINTVQRELIIGGMGSEINNMFHAAYNTLFALCISAFVIVGTFWIVRIISDIKSTDNGFIKYELYRKWNIGTAFLLLNMVALMFNKLAPIFIAMPYTCALTVTALVMFTYDSIIKSISKKRMTMTVPNNKRLQKLNIIFAVFATILAATTIIGICFFAVFFKLWILGIYMTVISSIVTIGLAIAYVIAYIAIVRSENKK